METMELPSNRKIKPKKDDRALSQEDMDLRDEMLALVSTLHSKDNDKHVLALESLKKHCQTGATAMTCLPKYIRFLYDKITELKEIHSSWEESYEPRKDLANIISAVSIMDTESNDCLVYRRLGRMDDISKWGIEYVRHLAEELRNDYENRFNNGEHLSTLLKDVADLVYNISAYYISNYCEIDAVDLHLDIDYYERLEGLINSDNVDKICRYLMQCAFYSLKEEMVELVRFIFHVFWRFNYACESFVVACRILDSEFFHEVLLKVVDEAPLRGYNKEHALIMQKQLCFMLAHYGIYYDFSDETKTETKCNTEELFHIIHNMHLGRAHSDLVTELDILKPLSPDDIHKINNQKLNAYYSAGFINDPARLSLGSAIVSGLVNAAFQTDALLTSDSSYKWLLTQKETSLMNCVACIGLLYMWDIDEAMLKLDTFLNSNNRYIKAGAILAVGIASSNTIDLFRSNLALLNDYLSNNDTLFKKNAIMAIGLAYAGTDDSLVVDYLLDVISSSNSDMQIKGMSSISIGLVACATSFHLDACKVIVDVLNNNKDKLSLSDPYARLIPLGIGLLYAGRTDSVSREAKDLEKLPGEFGKWCKVIVKICSNIGTGNAIAIQKLIDYTIDTPKSPIDKDLVRSKSEKEAFRFSNEASIEAEDATSNKSQTVSIEPLKVVPIAAQPESLDNGSTSTLKSSKVSSSPEKKGVKASSQQGKESSNEAAASTQDKEGPSAQPTSGVKQDKPLPSSADHKSGKSNGEAKTSTGKRDSKRGKDANIDLELIQGLATLGVSFISIGDDIHQKMALRLNNSFLQFGSHGVRRAVPIALGVLYASNPQVGIIELLSKLSHDIDASVSSNAIIALGMVAAGTNNSRVANLLRNLNIFFYRDSVHLFAIRIAQGLVHLSKGVMTVTPTRAEGNIMSPVTIASLLVHAVLSLDIKTNYLSMDPHMFFWLVPSMKLRALITYDENMKMVPVTVRVGQPVDEIGQAGKPKRITAFQTHRTPILLNVGERVEIATDKYAPYSNFLDGIVIVKPCPEESSEETI